MGQRFRPLRAFIFCQLLLFKHKWFQLHSVLPLPDPSPPDCCRVWFGDGQLRGEVTEVPWAEFGGASTWTHQLQLPLWAGGPGMGHSVDVFIKRSTQRSVVLLHNTQSWQKSLYYQGHVSFYRPTFNVTGNHRCVLLINGILLACSELSVCKLTSIRQTVIFFYLNKGALCLLGNIAVVKCYHCNRAL